MRFLQLRNGYRLKTRAILAMDKSGVIGYDGKLIFNNPKDLKYFQHHTRGNICVMGRKTFESIGKVLPDRQTIIMTQHKSQTEEMVAELVQKQPIQGETPYPIICTRIRDIPALFKEVMPKMPTIYICGGATIYELFKQYIQMWLVTRYEIDVVHEGVEKGLLPKKFKPAKIERFDPSYLHNFSWTTTAFDEFDGIGMVYRNYQIYYPSFYP